MEGPVMIIQSSVKSIIDPTRLVYEPHRLALSGCQQSDIDITDIEEIAPAVIINPGIEVIETVFIAYEEEFV